MRIFLFFILIPFTVSAQVPLKEKIKKDILELGRPASLLTKEVVFKVGDGANDPSLSVDTTDKVFDFNKSLVTRGDSLAIGDGSNSNKFNLFDIGLGINNPFLGWDSATNSLVFSNDGVISKKIGSGTGAGTGENAFTDAQNANAEDGVTAPWTNTGGTFAVTASDPLEGDFSFEYTPSAQNDFVRSALLDFDRSTFRGRNCEIGFTYVGGDENLTLKIVDGNGDTLGSKQLEARTISSDDSAFFLCPTAAAIGGDSNKGDLFFEVINLGASAAPLIRFDKAYAGTNRLLAETTLPDVLSARIENNGTATILSQKGDAIATANRSAAGQVDITFPAGTFTELYTVSVTPDSAVSGVSGSWRSKTLTSVQIVTTDAVGSGTDVGFDIEITKQGADAKQSVQVFQSIPKVSENENDLSSNIQNNGSASVLSQNIPFIDSVNRVGVGTVDISWSSLGLTSAPAIGVTSITSAEEHRVENLTSTGATVKTFSGTDVLTDSDFSFSLKKQGLDYKTPIVQPILINQVSTRARSGAEKGSCHIQNNGTATFDSTDPDCWLIQSVNRVALGDVHVQFIATGFKCTATSLETTRSIAMRETGGGSITTPQLPQTISVLNEVLGTAANSDDPFSINCSLNR